MENRFDFIIIGQGIAGTFLTYFLQKREASVLVIDKYNDTSSSNISAGIIHPITGRRKVKTWMADMLVPFAEECYAAIEKQSGQRFYQKLNILELIDNTKDYNDWLMRSADPEMKDYFSDEDTKDLYNTALLHSSKIAMTHCGWLDVKKLLTFFRDKLVAEDRLIDESFHPDNLTINENEVIYKGKAAAKIIFCEGWLAAENPLWAWLPFLPAKGEILTVHCPGLNASHIIIKNIFILPLGNDLYRVGSNYEWKELNETPTEKIKDELITKLRQIITLPFQIINHQAAVRPAVENRRPLIGFHPKHKNAGIFNGLGTKGVSLAPYFANQFVQYLYKEEELNAEVTIDRFKV